MHKSKSILLKSALFASLAGLIYLYSQSALAQAGLPAKSKYTEEFKAKIEGTARSPRTLEVGPGKQFRLPSDAAKYAQDGDTINISAATNYQNDYAIWKQNQLVIRGVGGRPHIKNTKMIDNGKAIWIIKGNNITIENIEFSGAKVRDKNGAGLRIEGTDLIVKNCYFHNNENGILSGKNPESTITVINNEFSNNGYGQGKTHNIYIGDIKKLRFIGNFSHHAKTGHTLKSRARRNEILYNMLVDGPNGRASYLIDLPNGGYSIVMGNVIQQSPDAENWALLSYGMEGLPKNRENYLYVVYNTFINNRDSGIFLHLKGSIKGVAANNIFAGKGKVMKGELELRNNFFDEDFKVFNDISIFDYHLRKDAPFIDKGISIKTSEGENLLPKYQIELNGLVKRKQIGQGFDPGAFEYWRY